MSAQPHRQITNRVYLGMKMPTCPITQEDWAIIWNSSLVRRKAWAFSMSPAITEDALIMIDLTIESTAQQNGA
jgi:hypothetical protein